MAPIVTVIRPQLSKEEYERRLEMVRESIARFWIAVEAERRAKSAQDASHGLRVQESE